MLAAAVSSIAMPRGRHESRSKCRHGGAASRCANGCKLVSPHHQVAGSCNVPNTSAHCRHEGCSQWARCWIQATYKLVSPRQHGPQGLIAPVPLVPQRLPLEPPVPVGALRKGVLVAVQRRVVVRAAAAGRARRAARCCAVLRRCTRLRCACCRCASVGRAWRLVQPTDMLCRRCQRRGTAPGDRHWAANAI